MRKNRVGRRILCLLLCATMVGLMFVSCGKEEDTIIETDKEGKTIGGYVETKSSITGNPWGYEDMEISREGTDRVVINCLSGGGWIKNVSTDYGQNFVKEDAIASARDMFRRTVAYLPDNECLWVISYEDEPTIDCGYIDGEGQENFISFERPMEAAGSYGTAWAGQDGRFYMTVDRGLYLVNLQTNKLEFLFDSAEGFDYVFVSGDYLYGVEETGLKMYKLSTGQLVEPDSVLADFIAKSGSKITLCDDGVSDRIYVVSRQGIYAHVPFGNSMEMLLDGRLCSLYSKLEYFDSVVAVSENDIPVFLVLNDKTVYRYEYDRDARLEDIKTLDIFSMYESSLVDTAIKTYSSIHPDMIINYSVGISDGSTVTENDVLKQLSTDFATGNAPDILLMDGLPYNSYKEKDLLLDLTDIASDYMADKGLNENVVNIYEEGDRLYCIPATYSYAILVGKCEYIENVTSLEELADAVERYRDEHGEKQLLFHFLNARQALGMFSVGSYGSFINENGLNTGIVSDYLFQSKRIYDVQMELMPDNVDINSFWAYDNWFGRFSGVMGEKSFVRNIAMEKMSSNLEGVKNQFSVGWMSSDIEEIATWQSCMKKSGDESYIPMPGTDRYGFTANNLMAINKNTDCLNESKELVKYVLGSTFQKKNTDSLGAIPVNNAACFSYKEDPQLRITSYGFVGDEDYIEVIWPTEEEIDELRNLTLKYETMQSCPPEIYDKIMEEGARYLTGECSLDTVMDNIEKTVKIYLAE